MREPVRDKERIQHILDAIETIESSRLKYSASESASQVDGDIQKMERGRVLI